MREVILRYTCDLCQAFEETDRGVTPDGWSSLPGTQMDVCADHRDVEVTIELTKGESEEGGPGYAPTKSKIRERRRKRKGNEGRAPRIP